jgi:hypothetical protein
MAICSCKFPLIIVDERDGKEITYLGMPIETIEEMEEFGIPDLEVIETESLKGIIGQYMKVTWQKPREKAKKYDVVGHIVTAGCPEDALECDVKSIYEVYHPIDEWIDFHIIELKGKENKDKEKQ